MFGSTKSIALKMTLHSRGRWKLIFIQSVEDALTYKPTKDKLFL